MSDYPEHDKLAAISEQSQICGEFVEWLESKGIQLMTWREDLTDTRPTDPECKARRDRADYKDACKPPRPVDGPAEINSLYAPSGVIYWMQHCTHWLNREAECCLCGKGQVYEVTGIRSWVHPGKNLTGLLAEFFEIDQRKIEAEKRVMLERCREMASR